MNNLKISKYLGILFLILTPPTPSFSQIKLNPKIEELLQTASLDLDFERLGNYKIRKGKNNYIQAYDLALYSRKEKLEIRLCLQPVDSTRSWNRHPQLESFRMLTSVATNDTAAHIVLHQMEDSALSRTFNADWGAKAFFQPKVGFSDKRNCKLLSLFAEGKGLVQVFFLFDEPSVYLDEREAILQFL